MLKICRTELTEIETCSECYHNANKKNLWFVEACDRPHLLVWAKLKGFPFWPAKAMSINGSQVDVRFFGEHDRAWIPNTACLLYSEKDPNPLSKSKKNNINDCIKEVNQHIEKLKEKFGAFNYAEFRSPLELGLEQEYIKKMLPNLRRAELKTEIKAKSLTLKFVKQPGLTTKNDATKIYQVMNNNGDESEQVRSMILKRKDNWKSVPVETEEETPVIVPTVPKKGKIKNSSPVAKKDEQHPSTSKDPENSNKFQRVYSAASGLLGGTPNVESKKNAMKRRKSTRPATVVPPSPPVDQLIVNENTTTEPTNAPEGRRINARKTRSKSGHSDPSDEPPPKSARMAARLKTMKPQEMEGAAVTTQNEQGFSIKEVKGGLQNRLKSVKNVTQEKENQEEEKSIKNRKIDVEPEAIFNVIVKEEPLSDDDNVINNNQLDISDYDPNNSKNNILQPSIDAAALDLPTQKQLHQHPVARKARKTFPQKLPIPIMPPVTVQSDALDKLTTINSMVCIPQLPKFNQSKISEIPPLVAMCQPSTSSTSSTSSIKLKTVSAPLFPSAATNGESYQKLSILPNMSTGMASAIAETIIGTIPPRLTPRPPHPLRSDGTTFHRDCGPVTRTLNDNAHSMTDFFRKLIVDILSEISSVHPEARVHALQVQIEELTAQHEREITDIKRNTGEIFYLII